MHFLLAKIDTYCNKCVTNVTNVTRAGLVIGHTGHFPGGPTHLRGRQNVIYFIFFAKKRAACGPLVCLPVLTA